MHLEIGQINDHAHEKKTLHANCDLISQLYPMFTSKSYLRREVLRVKVIDRSVGRSH